MSIYYFRRGAIPLVLGALVMSSCNEVGDGYFGRSIDSSSQDSASDEDKTGMPKAPFPSSTPQASPACVPGKRMAVWKKSPTSLPLEYLGSFVSYSGELSAKANYNYYSASAHPIVGPTPLGYAGHTFMYTQNGTSAVFLNLFFNIDEGGSAYNTVKLKVTTRSNNGLDNVVLSDDSGEFEYSDSQNGERTYQGNFQYWKNTDGFVLGPFKGEDFSIEVAIEQSGDIEIARFYSADGTNLNLTRDVAGQKFSSFIINFESYETCGQ